MAPKEDEAQTSRAWDRERMYRRYDLAKWTVAPVVWIVAAYIPDQDQGTGRGHRMSLLLTVSAIWVAVFAWVCLFKVVPGTLTAMFRHRLWRERDELAAEVRRGVYVDRAPAEQVMRNVEAVIGLAPRLTPICIGLLRASESCAAEENRGDVGLEVLRPGEREKLEARMRGIGDLVGNHVLLETPSGWLILILGAPFALVIALSRRLRKKAYGGTLADGLMRRFAEGAADLACRQHPA